MTITNGYATLNEYKAWVAVRGLDGQVTTDPSDDGTLEIIIEAASRYMDDMTGRKFWADTVDATRYYTPVSNYDPLPIDDLSAAPTSVSVDYTEGQRTYTALTATQYDMTPDNALLDGRPYTAVEINPVYSAYFPVSRRSVKVVGKFGFPSIPKPIKEAVLNITQSISSARSGQSSIGRITVTASGLVIRPEEVPPMAMTIISNYRDRT